MIGGDVVQLSAAYWGVLPLCASLLCHVDYSPLSCIVTNSRAVCEALKRRKRVVFGLLEWSDLVSSFENERACPMLFAQWCEWKLQRPTWRLNRRDTLGVIGDQVPAQGSSIGQVLRGWGMQLAGVTYGAVQP